MNKEYLSPEMQVVKISMDVNILAESLTFPGGEGEPLTKEYNDVSNDNTNGSNIWDKEW